MEELLLRRRIRRVLVICPAMLQRQWQIELARKFNLNFEIIDSDSTFQLRRRMGIDTNPWKADRLRLRVEIDALCADLYGLDPEDLDWIVRDDPKDPKGFYRVDRQLPFRERLTGLSAAAFRALKDGKWSAETAGQLSNDEFFEILGIPELTSATAAKSKGLAGPLIQKRDGCHAWHPESFPSDDPRHGWTWHDCRQDAITLLGSEEALDQYIAQMVDGTSSLVSGNEIQLPTTNYHLPKPTSSATPSPPTSSATKSAPRRNGDANEESARLVGLGTGDQFSLSEVDTEGTTTMKQVYLEVTFRSGEPLAAYLYLPRQEGDRSARVEKHGTGLLVDLSDDGRPIGIEIAIPSRVTVEAFNKILEAYGLDRIDEAELAP